MANTVYNPNTSNLSDSSVPANDLAGKQGEKITADLHGKWYNANIRKNVFKANVSAVTVTAVANNLVSVFGLYNPPGSGVIGEIITTEVGHVVAASVVNVLGWYFSTSTQSAASTFSTIGVAGTNLFSARVGETPANSIRFYSAITHSGTPVLVDLVASWNQVTNPTEVCCDLKKHEGALLLPPGILMSLAMSTTVGVTSGTALGVTWAEWPYVN